MIAAIADMSPPITTAAPAQRPLHLLLRSSWQTVNIGDIGHSPGVLTLLEKNFPDAIITLWPDLLDRGVRPMLQRRFPRLHIADGIIDPATGLPTTPALADAIAEADLLIHGSGPGIVALPHLEAWTRLTHGKPYGIYAITIDPLGAGPAHQAIPNEGDTIARQRALVAQLPPTHLAARERRVLESASFVFCRDTLTLDYLRAQNLRQPRLDFAPDGAFAIDLRDDTAAATFLRNHDLHDREFICVIPRLRFTPYHETHDTRPTPRDEGRALVSARHREADMEKLRALITRWVRATGLRVLVCSEMTYQVELGRDLIRQNLPEDVRDKVVWRPGYWLPDEACSTYARAHTVVSLDNHSPIFALAVGTPTIFVRQPSDTTKGQMWTDVGLGDWYFEITDPATTSHAIADRLLAIHHDRPAALARVKTIMSHVRTAQARSITTIKQTLPVSEKFERVQKPRLCAATTT
ncbi:polysaccharide pyruvyl transferase family protein [Geminisphaera colitermitum]|uniref:polysaccharide pyruvyl transferase family protein n=1 Tax=Geminisphaera colitermitum TaxID=1148786 RepID=UPI000B496D9A|nr:polysaccharide pyruvyl transferase family protein [Geminisphaera colitermitum]